MSAVSKSSVTIFAHFLLSLDSFAGAPDFELPASMTHFFSIAHRSHAQERFNWFPHPSALMNLQGIIKSVLSWNEVEFRGALHRGTEYMLLYDALCLVSLLKPGSLLGWITWRVSGWLMGIKEEREQTRWWQWHDLSLKNTAYPFRENYKGYSS